jgi:hypothetical protein
MEIIGASGAVNHQEPVDLHRCGGTLLPHGLASLPSSVRQGGKARKHLRPPYPAAIGLANHGFNSLATPGACPKSAPSPAWRL